MADPSGKTARVARSRAACFGCRSTRQRCDGPSRIPCRRCELYGLDCVYKSARGLTGPNPGTPAGDSSTSQPSTSDTPRPTASNTISNFSTDVAMADRLRDISESLHMIQSTLAGLSLASAEADRNDHESSDSPGSGPSSFGRRPSSKSTSATSISGIDAGHLLGDTASNPLQTVISQITILENITKEKSASNSPEADWNTAQGMSNLNSRMERLFSGMTLPDAIIRNVMTAQECDTTFQLFHQKVTPWTQYFDMANDKSASVVRERSPLLFHVMLLTASYYLIEASERGEYVYYALMSLVNELMAPLIISPQSHQITADFVKALCLLITYKPVQHAALYQANIVEAEEAEHACKLNSFSSSIIGGLLSRTSVAIHLNTAPTVFLKNFSSTVAIAPKILSDLRLWYWLTIIDMHGSVSIGRATALSMDDALKTTRKFASLKNQLWDVRLAAMLELYATPRGGMTSIWASKSRTVAAADLKKFNKDFDDWEAYWEPLLAEAADGGDQLAQTSTLVFGGFIRLTLNSSVFFRWNDEHQRALAQGSTERPDLSDDDWYALALAVRAIERLVYCLSVESRVNGNAFNRQVNWSNKSNGPRPSLTLDSVVVAMHQTALDPVTCVLYSFALITLAKLANAGLIVCELQTTQESYSAGLGSSRPQRLVYGSKLGVLLEIGAAFLDGIAATRSHPAKKHARMLRAILAAGTSSDSPSPEPQEVPHHHQSPQAETLTIDLANGIGDFGRRRSSGFTVGSESGFNPLGSFAASSPPPTYPGSNQPSYLPPQTNFAPSVPLQPTTPLSPKKSEAGEALAAILGGFSPALLGQIGYFDSLSSNNFSDNSINVDWESYLQPVQQQPVQQQPPPHSHQAWSMNPSWP